MSYTVGFDLGTHQTKICIQDSSNAAEKIYEFFEFAKPDGTTTVLFPSLVQINKDSTISYGYADESQCLQLKGKELEKPILLQEDMPLKPSMPAKRKAAYPKKPVVDPWKDSLLKLKGVKTASEKWIEECADIDRRIEEEWKSKCQKLQESYDSECKKIESRNSIARDKYNREFKEWKKSLEKEKCRFRYFKLRAFTNTGTWPFFNFDSKEVSVWYIAYILILLRERFGDDDVSIQFGAPVGASGSDTDRMVTNRAYSLYIAAYNLANEYNSIADYMSATYKELRSKTKIEKVNEDIINQYIFDDIPEAFAGLIAVTTQKRLGYGFHILADIGGGTTDMAMFFIDKDTHLPDVITISSFAKGLNYVFERTHERTDMPLGVLQEEFFLNSKNKIFTKAVKEYKQVFTEHGIHFQDRLFDSFDRSKYHHGRRRCELEKALENHPIVYCGGGSVYPSLQSSIGLFTDKRNIDKDLLNIRNVRNEKNIPNHLYAILAISYGLASYEKDYDRGIKCTDISVVFQKCLPKVQEDSSNSNEYGMLDD